MNKILFFIFALILVACSTPQVTVTSTSTITLTSPPTKTQLPTNTPEPPIYAEAQDFFGEEFEVTSEGALIDRTLRVEIPDFKIVPYEKETMIITKERRTDPDPTWVIERKYNFEDQEDFTVYIIKEGIRVVEGSGLDMFGWTYEKGELKRQNIKFEGPNGTTVEVQGYSPQEVHYLIMTNGSTDPKYMVNGFQAMRKLVFNLKAKASGQTGYIITYKGMAEFVDRSLKYYGNTFIPTLGVDGTWTKVDTTLFMVYPKFKDRNKALVVWMGTNNQPVIVAMEGKWLDIPGQFHPYWSENDIKDAFSDS